MPKRVKCRSSFTVIIAVSLALTLTAFQVAKADECSAQGSVRLCVVSAALTSMQRNTQAYSFPAQYNTRRVTVSVTLKATNISDVPIDVALVGGKGGDWSFTPKNSEAILNYFNEWSVSGIQTCNSYEQCVYTNLSPSASLLIQIQYNQDINLPGLPLIQVASTAAFTTAMIVSERGVFKLVSFALDGFTFGNSVQAAQ